MNRFVTMTAAQYQAQFGTQRELHAALSRTPAPPDRYRSATERRFVQEWLTPAQQEGKIRRWWYEPCKGLYLAPRTSYTPDFLLETVEDLVAPGVPDPWPLVFVEVKGEHIRDKDWIKAKQAAALYPCFGFVLFQWRDQQWTWKRIPCH